MNTKNSYIIAADDDDMVRNLLKLYIQLQGEIVVTAANADEVWDIAQERVPKAVICDVEMPGTLDGFELGYKFKKDEKLKESIFVVMTAHSQKASAQVSDWIGADLFLSKPFEQKDIIKVLQEINDKYAKQHQD